MKGMLLSSAVIAQMQLSADDAQHRLVGSRRAPFFLSPLRPTKKEPRASGRIARLPRTERKERVAIVAARWLSSGTFLTLENLNIRCPTKTERSMVTADRMLKFAADCELMAKASRSKENRSVWIRPAQRRCGAEFLCNEDEAAGPVKVVGKAPACEFPGSSLATRQRTRRIVVLIQRKKSAWPGPIALCR